MTELWRIFYAGCVHRWHANPHLAGTADRTDGHSARVARIIANLHPSPSAALLMAALRHDDGEAVVGDVSGEAKRQYPTLAAMLDAIEERHIIALWGVHSDLTVTEAAWLKFADRLDAWMWAKHHRAPMDGDGWPEAWARLEKMAAGLGIPLDV